MTKIFKKIEEYEIDILKYVNEYRGNMYDDFWLYITDPYSWIPLYLLFLYFIIQKFTRREVRIILITSIITLTLTTLFTEAVKESVMRVRPNNLYYRTPFLRSLADPSDHSFFSAHASNSMAITTLLFLYLKGKVKWAFLFFLWPIFFAYSRLCIAVHYPTDIIGGLITGYFIGAGSYNVSYHNFLDDDFST
jgi:undecaprenyl-diphosphatase